MKDKVMDLKGNIGKTRLLNTLMIVLYCIGMGFMFIGIPKVMDDYWYINQLRPWFLSQGIFYPEDGGNIFAGEGLWEGIKGVWTCHVLGDNVRLGNIMAPLFLIFPKWVGGGVSVLCLFYVMVGTFRLAGVDWRRSALVPLGIVLFMWCLPWFQNMAVLDYQMNYLRASALAVFLLNILERRRLSKIGLVGLFLLSVITGMWHEGISAPVLSGLVFLTIFYRSCRTRDFMVAEIGLLIGFSLLWLSPGMRDRLVGQRGFNMTISEMGWVVVTGSLLLVDIIIYVYEAIKRGWRNVLSDRYMNFVLVSGIASLTIVVRTGIALRDGWWCMLVSILGFLRLLQTYHGVYWQNYRRSNLLITVPLLAVVYLQCGITAYLSLEFRKLHRQYIEAYLSKPDETVFGKIYDLHNMPLLSAYLPFAHYPNETMVWVGIYYKSEEMGWPGFQGVVPEELRDVDAGSGRLVPGGTEIREKDGYLFAPFRGDSDFLMRMWVDMGRGTVMKQARAFEFTSERDGQRYIYIYLFNNWVDAHFGKVKSIEPRFETIEGPNPFVAGRL